MSKKRGKKNLDLDDDFENKKTVANEDNITSKSKGKGKKKGKEIVSSDGEGDVKKIHASDDEEEIKPAAKKSQKKAKNKKKGVDISDDEQDDKSIVSNTTNTFSKPATKQNKKKKGKGKKDDWSEEGSDLDLKQVSEEEELLKPITKKKAKNKKKAVADSDESDDEDSKSVVSNVSNNGTPQPKSKKAKANNKKNAAVESEDSDNEDSKSVVSNVSSKIAPPKSKNKGTRLQKTRKNIRDCSGSGTCKGAQYTYFSRLSFQQKSIDNNETTINMEEQRNEIQEKQNEVNNETSQIKPSATEATEIRPPKRKKRYMPEELIRDLIERNIDSQQSFHNELLDEDKLFCLSLYKELKKVPENYRLTTKTELLQVIIKGQALPASVHFSTQQIPSYWQGHQ